MNEFNIGMSTVSADELEQVEGGDATSILITIASVLVGSKIRNELGGGPLGSAAKGLAQAAGAKPPA